MNAQIAQIVRASVHRFIGRLGREPELRFFDSGNAVCNCRLLVNQPGARRDDGSEPDGFKLEIWGERAQEFADTCAKGALVDVTGRVRTEAWTDGNGQEREQQVIRIEQWALLRPAGQGQGQPQQQQSAPAPAQRTTPAPAPAHQQRAPF